MKRAHDINLLGPLTNPAKSHTGNGVFDRMGLNRLARVYKNVAAKHVIGVHAEDGM